MSASIRFRQSHRLLPYAVLVLGLCLVLTGTWWLNDNNHNKARIRFLSESQHLITEIDKRLQLPLYGLNGAKSLFGVNPELSNAEFHRALSTRNLPKEFPGMRAIGFIERVENQNLDQFIKLQKEKVDPQFALQEFTPPTDSERNDHYERYITKYFYTPFQSHLPLGVDMGSDARHKTALLLAIDSGKPSLSEFISSPIEQSKKSLVVLFNPIYRAGATLANLEQRRAALIGVLFAPIELDALMNGMEDINNHTLILSMSSMGNLPGREPIRFQIPQDSGQKNTRQALFHFSQIFTVHGRQIQVNIDSDAEFESSINKTIPILFFCTGFLISFLLCVLLRQQINWREHTQKKLDDAVSDNDALLSTLNLHAIVSVCDAQGNIIDINDAFCKISGYQKDELIGQNHRINSSGIQDKNFWQKMWQSIAEGTPWRGEVCNRSKEGKLYWLDTFIAPFANSEGVIEKYIAISTDITANKKAAELLEAAVRDNDALLSTLNMHAIVSIADSTGRIIEVNQAYCRISGYTREEIIDGNHRIIATGIQSPDFLSNMWRTISSGTPWRGEVCNRAKNGNVYWVDTFIAPFKNAQGQIEKYVSIRTDITNSKKAASRLANQRSALANIIEGTNVGTWEWNVETGEMRVNERWAEQVGYEVNELVPITINTWDELTHPKDLMKSKEKMKQHFQHDLPYYEYETRLRHKNGNWIWVLTRGRVSSFNEIGKPAWVSGTQMDITERKNAEAELKTSTQLLLTVRDQLTKAAEVAELGIWTWDLKNNLFTFNDRMFDMYETPEQERKPALSYEYWRSKIHPDDVDETETRLYAAIKGSNAYNPIFRVIGKNKEVRYIQSAGEVERDQNNEAIRVTGINRDITLQYQTEEALRQAKQAADDANQAKSNFLANMSHEIRTPLNAIMGMLTLLRRTALTGQQEDYTKKTESAARSLLNLLNDILDISKVEAGKMSLDPHPFLLDQLLNDISVILSISASNKPVTVRFKIDNDIPNHLLGDSLRLRQILTNLGSNAVKFTEQGEVTVSVRHVEKNAQASTLQFSVRDTGIGIAGSNQQKIFTGFTQAETSTTRRHGGTGLGLAISQRFVKMMGGELQLESEIGKGSLFHFTIELPVVEDELSPYEASLASTKANIMIIERDLAARDLWLEMSASLNWDISFEDSSDSVFQTLNHTMMRFDAIYLDWNSVKRDGLGNINKIHALTTQQGLPITLIMSASEFEANAINPEQSQTPFDRVLIKPITSDVLQGIDKTFRSHAINEKNAQDGTQTGRRHTPLKDILVLLVEDNLNNQQVARELLEDEGANIHIANNGLEAVKLIASGRFSYDLILMDLQMPIMDGFTATQKIRKDLGKEQLPIIAMTANAMESDREACIKAGFHDHIGKPFEINHLVNTILRYTKRINAHSLNDTIEAPIIDAELSQIAQQAGIEIEAALRRIGRKKELYLRMLQMYIRDLEKTSSQLPAMFENTDIAEVMRQLHTIKGLAATLGVNDLHSHLSSFEKQLAQTADMAGRKAMCAEICKLALERSKALQSFADKMQATITISQHEHNNAATNFDANAFRHALLELAEQLENADMAATETIVQLQHQFGAIVGNKLQLLELAISALDFSLAKTLCDDLIASTNN